MRACPDLCLSVVPQGAVKHSAGNMENAQSSVHHMTRRTTHSKGPSQARPLKQVSHRWSCTLHLIGVRLQLGKQPVKFGIDGLVCLLTSARQRHLDSICSEAQWPQHVSLVLQVTAQRGTQLQESRQEWLVGR